MKKSVVGWISVGCIIIALVLVGMFQGYLGARVIGVKGGRISVRQGEVLSLQLPTTTAPSMKVELCQEGKVPEKCVLLASKAKGKTAKVTIPKTAVLGKAIIKFTERDTAGTITTNVLMRRAVLVVKAKATPAPAEESGGGGGGGGSGGGGSGDNGSSSSTNSSPEFSQTTTSDGRTMTIQVDHSELIAGQTNRVTVTYALDHWAGTYDGHMEVMIGSPDVSNFSPNITERRFWDEVNPKGTTYLVFPYSIPNGQSASFSFDVKVPPVGYKGRNELPITSQLNDTYGPYYVDGNGNSVPGNLNVSRTLNVSLPIR